MSFYGFYSLFIFVDNGLLTVVLVVMAEVMSVENAIFDRLCMLGQCFDVMRPDEPLFLAIGGDLTTDKSMVVVNR